MAENCQLRPVSRADLPALVELERGAFGDPWTEAQLRTALDWPGALAFIAEDDRGVAGYVLGRMLVDDGEVLSIATAVDRRRNGIGRRLLHAIVTAMVERGAHGAWLEVRISNAAARALYHSAGFVAAGLRRGYYRHPEEDALVLRRELGATASDRSALR